MALILAISMCKKEPELPVAGNRIDFNSNTVDSVGYREATIITIVSSLGSNTISQHGHCWNTEEEPTISGNHTAKGPLTQTDTFTSQITELTPGTRYFIRSFLTIKDLTVYGPQVEITTLKTGRPNVITVDVSNIMAVSAICGGNVVSDSGWLVTARGICWDEDSIFTLDACLGKITHGTGIGNYSDTITGLAEGNTYFVKAFATNQEGTEFGVLRKFSTLMIVPPAVTTSTDPETTAHIAVCGGNVTNAGNGTVTERGVCWNNTGNPTLINSLGHIASGSGTGEFLEIISDLDRKQAYVVAAYAINEKDTAYGATIPFETKCELPTVVTGLFEDITSTTLNMVNNRVTDEGGGPVFERGVCWSHTTNNPTLENYEGRKANGSGSGFYDVSITGLMPDTWYSIRAYASNEDSTGYGNVNSFKTQPYFNCGNSFTLNHTSSGSVAPVNKTVTYGTVSTSLTGSNKCWITQNLGATHQATSATDATEASAGWYWQFNKKQGYQYDGTMRTPNTVWITPINENNNWQAANDPCALLLGSGWQIPTITEWNNADVNDGWDSYVATYNSELKLHAAGLLSYDDGDLQERGTVGYYWSSSQSNNSFGWRLILGDSYADINYGDKATGRPVRCLKD